MFPDIQEIRNTQCIFFVKDKYLNPVIALLLRRSSALSIVSSGKLFDHRHPRVPYISRIVPAATHC